jgi:hypothetical protein
MLQLLFLLAMVGLGTAEEAVPLNVFLTEGENWLLFPHRVFQIDTYTTECSLEELGYVTEHKLFETIGEAVIRN